MPTSALVQTRIITMMKPPIRAYGSHIDQNIHKWHIAFIITENIINSPK